MNNVTVYYHLHTRNKTFLNMVDYLSRVGIQNNKFFCILFDPDLYNIDPFDPNISALMKQKVAIECTKNYWYFIRECVKIPDQGSTEGGARYRLDRGNLALNYCLVRNLNIFIELPRQFGKTISICCRLLWEYLFGTTNSEIMLLNKKHDDSKLNLQRIKDIRSALPQYLQLRSDTISDATGKKIKAKENVTYMENTINKNAIKTAASARSKMQADSLGRGCTQPRQWYDEFAFIPFNKEIYMSATPAFSKASENARRNGAPYGKLISTTPGILTEDMGKYAFVMKENATKFSEQWYDMNDYDVYELISKNTSSDFIHIKFTYKQLGAGEAYLQKMITEMGKEWEAIRREVLLEWAETSSNSPFTRDELNAVSNAVRDPIGQMRLCKYYDLNVYSPLNTRETIPIIGVDVSGGYSRDSSAITVIDSETTKVIADLKCNYIKPDELAACVVELVTKYAPRAIVNVERNGGFGAAVIALLMKSPIKNNLYYEYKERVLEEHYDGFKVNKRKATIKVYGTDSTKKVRELLIEILRQRMTNHKDKFISPSIYEELKTLEVKKSGKVEHSANGHDDQIFSYLMALYVWYYGEDLRERYGMVKTTLQTDENLAEEFVDIEEKYQELDISGSIMTNHYDSNGDIIVDEVASQMAYLNESKFNTEAEWRNKIRKADELALIQLLQTPLGRKAYKETYNATDTDIELLTNGTYSLGSQINDFYESNGIPTTYFDNQIDPNSPYIHYYANDQYEQ
jgi:hypothetical protein